ncbi:MAG: hypothetical protein IKK93_03240 [Campylobacter sp.]|nr:hypothetical protein [Campylobacter sp.]
MKAIYLFLFLINAITLYLRLKYLKGKKNNLVWCPLAVLNMILFIALFFGKINSDVEQPVYTTAIEAQSEDVIYLTEDELY